jgi:hypothetical protein
MGASDWACIKTGKGFKSSCVCATGIVSAGTCVDTVNVKASNACLGTVYSSGEGNALNLCALAAGICAWGPLCAATGVYTDDVCALTCHLELTSQSGDICAHSILKMGTHEINAPTLCATAGNLTLAANLGYVGIKQDLCMVGGGNIADVDCMTSTGDLCMIASASNCGDVRLLAQCGDVCLQSDFGKVCVGTNTELVSERIEPPTQQKLVFQTDCCAICLNQATEVGGDLCASGNLCAGSSANVYGNDIIANNGFCTSSACGISHCFRDGGSGDCLCFVGGLLVCVN